VVPVAVDDKKNVNYNDSKNLFMFNVQNWVRIAYYIYICIELCICMAVHTMI
jgi:hypothetical protein